MSGDERELQETAQQLERIESELEALQDELGTLRARRNEIDGAIETIGSLETGSTVQVPIGGGAYVRASVDDMESVIVGLGGGYATERTGEDAVGILEERRDRLDDRIDEVNESIAELESQGQQLGERAQQQLQRLRGGGGAPSEGG